MALYEFYCDGCQAKFEQITRADAEDAGVCPKCASKKNTRKLISRFAVGGQGDLRETTLHGCHDHTVAGPNQTHVHGPGCGHGGGSSSSGSAE